MIAKALQQTAFKHRASLRAKFVGYGESGLNFVDADGNSIRGAKSPFYSGLLENTWVTLFRTGEDYIVGGTATSAPQDPEAVPAGEIT